MVQVLFDDSSDVQRDAAVALRALHAPVMLLGGEAGRVAAGGEVICLDAELFAELPPAARASAWYAPLAWHADAVAMPAEKPGRVIVLHDSLAGLFPRARVELMAYPLGAGGIRRSDRESARQRLGLSPGRMAVFCREESSPLMRVMKALENDERVTVLTVEEAGDLDRHHPQAVESMLMGACDVFVAESSPKAVAESLAHGVPLMAFVRDEGDANARFLSEAAAGLVATRPGDMLMMLDALMASFPVEIQRMRRALDALRAGIPAMAKASRVAAGAVGH